MTLFKLQHGVSLEADITGAKNDPLVVLIPGAGAPRDFWPEAYVRAMADRGFRVLSYCHRDTGASDHFDAPYSINVLMADMWALVDLFDIASFHLVGHSMGGYMGLIAMAMSPGRLKGVTAISAGPTASIDRYAEFGMAMPDQATWGVLMSNAPCGDFKTDLPGWLKSWKFLNGARSFDEAAAVRYTRALYREDPRNAQVATNHIHAMSTLPADLPERFERAMTPLLVLHGEEDPLVPASHGRALAKQAGNANLVWLKGAGHMFFDEMTWNDILSAQLTHFKQCAV